MIKTILFDVGGTLEHFWTNDEIQIKGIQKLVDEFEKAGLVLDGSLEAISREFDEDRESYRQYRKQHNEVELSPEEICRRFLFIRRDFDREKMASLGETVCRIWEDDCYIREVKPDVEDTLKALAERGYQLGVVSNNSSRYQVFDGLKEYGINKYFKDITVSGVVGFCKPNPEIYMIALKQMDADPETTLFVGDSVNADVIGPRSVGINKSVFISKYSKDSAETIAKARPDMIITEFGELLTWLDAQKD